MKYLNLFYFRFKGECIEGLNGLLLKLDQKDSGKDRLKTWVFPKFRESRSHVILGPLAYLKRKEGNSNTEVDTLCQQNFTSTIYILQEVHI